MIQLHKVRKSPTVNYENPSIFVKVTAQKSVAPFYVDTGYICHVAAVLCSRHV